MPAKRQMSNLRTSVVPHCSHHWIIEYSQQTESVGRCRLCGEERNFVNKMSSSHRRSALAVQAMPLDGDETSDDVPSSALDDSGDDAL